MTMWLPSACSSKHDVRVTSLRDLGHENIAWPASVFLDSMAMCRLDFDHRLSSYCLDHSSLALTSDCFALSRASVRPK